MAYKPIEDYAMIGNMRTAALVGRDGAIDWLCWPYFDSPSVFGALLDHRQGGRFRIGADQQRGVPKQFYWPETNVLVTRFLSPGGVGEVVDFMPLDLRSDSPFTHSIIRIVSCARGNEVFQLECRPAFDYARASHTCMLTPHGARFSGGGLHLSLSSPVTLETDGLGVTARFVLNAGERCAFVLREEPPEGDGLPQLSADEANAIFQHTVHYWRRWLAQCSYTGRWR
jgi:GH15 family glucan-1,4-alpha-glucosidase